MHTQNQEWDVGRHDWDVSDTGVAPEGRGLKMHSGGKKQIAVGMHAFRGFPSCKLCCEVG